MNDVAHIVSTTLVLSDNDHAGVQNIASPITVMVAADTVASTLTAEATTVCRYEQIVIVGSLNLKYAQIHRPVEFTECVFTDAVDLHYAEFQQPLTFFKCTFLQGFNSGDRTESLTIYHKDLICNHSHFCGPASFNGAQVDGNALFNDAVFAACAHAADVPDVDFIGFTCKGGVEFICTTFKGHVTFNTIECHDAMFSGAQFLSTQGSVDFKGAVMAGNLQFDEAAVGALKQPARFKAGLDGTGIRCGRKALFTGAQFEGPQLVTFERADFGWKLDCRHTLFAGPVSFSGAQCAGDGIFRRAKFTYSQGHDNGDVDMRFFHLQGNLDMTLVRCTGVINLGQALVRGKLKLEGAHFKSKVQLYDTNIKIFELQSYHTTSRFEGFPFIPDSLDLTSCTFERFHAGREGQEQQLAQRFVQSQDPRRFSRDPYIQLEHYYQNNGQEHAARTIHLLGHEAIRQNALRPNGGSINWSRSQKLKDGALKWLTAWGLHTERLLFAALAFIILGTLVFLPAGSLQPVAGSAQGLSLTSFQHFAYSIDRFVPALDLGYANAWQPVGSGRIIYAFIHCVAGWTIIPLYVASLTGIIKSE